MSGTYAVSFSLYSNVEMKNFEHNNAFLYFNGVRITETHHETHGGSDDINTSAFVISTSGREFFIRAQVGDTIGLRTGEVESIYGFYEILTCFEYNAV